MLRCLFIGLIFVVVIFGAGSLSFAQHDHPQDQVKTEGAGASIEAVNVGNKICPVSGEKINEQFKAVYEYQGKVYNFCCAGCIGKFKEDPEKYIKIVDEELSQDK